MRYALLALALFAQLASAVTFDCAGTTVAQTYATTARLSTTVGSRKKHLAIINSTGKKICAKTSTNPNIAPSTGGLTEICAPASSFIIVDDYPVDGYVYYRSGSASDCTALTFELNAW